MSEPTNAQRGDAEPAPSWILELKERLAGQKPLAAGDEGSVVFLVPLYVHSGSLWTVLGEDVVDSAGDLARISFPAANSEEDEPPWNTAARILDEILGIEPEQALQIGELEEVASVGGLRVLPLVAAIPRPDMAGRTLSATTDAGLALFPLQVLSLLEPQRSERRAVALPHGTEEVEIITVDDHQIWGPTLQVFERLLATIAT